MNFCLGVLFSTSLANWRWLHGLFWWTLLFKMARLENQRSEGVGCDYDRMNTFFFPCLILPVVNRGFLSFTWYFFPVDVVHVKTESPFTFCKVGSLFLQLPVVRCLNTHICSCFTKKNHRTC